MDQRSASSVDGQDTGPTTRQVTFGWRRAVWTYLATLLGVNIVLVIGIRTGRWDAVDESCPYFTLVADAARQGQLVLWTPLVNGGCPAGFDPQIGAASPLELLVGLVGGGNEFGFRLYWLVVWCLGGIGVMVLARQLKAAAWIGCVAAIGYSFSAIYTSHASHTSYLLTMSIFPWVLARLDAAITGRSLFAAVQAGALWGLSALGGYPGLVLAGAMYAVAWGFGRVLFADKCDPTSSLPTAQGKPVAVCHCFAEAVHGVTGEPDTACAKQWHTVATNAALSPARTSALLRKLGFLALVLSAYFMTGLAVLSPTYVGFMAESQGYTNRGRSLSRKTVLNQGMPPTALTTFASPYLSVWNAKSCDPLWCADVTMSSVYVSPLLLILALSAGAGVSNSRFRWLLLALGVFYLLLALGGTTPLYGWFFDLVPPVRYLRFAALFRCYYIPTVVVLALLAAGNTAKLLEEGSSRVFWTSLLRVSSAVAGLAFVSFAAVIWLVPGNRGEVPQLLLAVAHVVCIWLAVALLAIWGLKSERMVREKILYRFLVILTIADAALTIGLSTWTVYGGLQQWQTVAAKHVESLDLTDRGLDRQLSTDVAGLPRNNNLLSKTPTLTGYSCMANSFHAQYAENPVLSRSALGSQRIWFSPSAVRVPLSDNFFQKFLAAAKRTGRPCLVLSDRGERFRSREDKAPPEQIAKCAKEMAESPPVEPISATLVEYTPNRLILDVTAPHDGWLLVTDRWAAGWRAAVNGEDAEVWIGNFIFRAVRVREGANRVAFRYCPAGHPWLLLLSWATLGAVLAATVALPVIRKRIVARRER